MNANEYQLLALRTFRTETDSRERLLNCALGIAGEAGEVVDHIKKHVYHGHELDKTKVATELGDLQYYIAVKAAELGFALTDIMQMNIDKLETRYPGGEFSTAASIARRDVE